MAQQNTVLITGATGRIGAACARLLAAAGHHVVLGARGTGRLARLVAEIRAAGGSAECRAVDVTDADDAQAFVLAAHRRHGRVDVLVNAASSSPRARMDHLKLMEWDGTIDVNLRGTLYAIAAVLPLMRIARAGHVVNLAGGYAGPGGAVAGATAAAVRSMSDVLREEEPHLRVTVVSPDQGEEAVARSIACAVAQPDRLPGRRSARPLRLLTWGGGGRGTSGAQTGSRSPASPR